MQHAPRENLPHAAHVGLSTLELIRTIPNAYISAQNFSTRDNRSRMPHSLISSPLARADGILIVGDCATHSTFDAATPVIPPPRPMAAPHRAWTTSSCSSSSGSDTTTSTTARLPIPLPDGLDGVDGHLPRLPRGMPNPRGSHSSTEYNCLICGGRTTKYNFACMSCNACRQFFKRVVAN